MVERKAFLENPKHQYHLSQCGDMIVGPFKKRMEIIMHIQVFLFSQIKINYMENDEKKTFLVNESIIILYPNLENMIVVPIIKGMEIITSIKV